MGVEAKICGIGSEEAMAAALEGGAAFVGLVFYPRSPRHVDFGRAAALARQAQGKATVTGLLVDADDAAIKQTLARVPLDLLQLHGSESPRRVAEIRSRFGLPVMKVLKVEGADDIAAAGAYIQAADRLLFDAKAPKNMAGALPGGNALSFDWQLLAGKRWPLPWMLSGGLTADNLEDAVKTSGARAVDVSSGVERKPGVKDPARIHAFLAGARRL
ncbi:MAG: phosphoribosylanthranilate isomerase [Rhodovibrionaceae bacterium]|nr:phosphoribosylanthranilate isomerase [Rhodovibrionaceae bacterium]